MRQELVGINETPRKKNLWEKNIWWKFPSGSNVATKGRNSIDQHSSIDYYKLMAWRSSDLNVSIESTLLSCSGGLFHMFATLTAKLQSFFVKGTVNAFIYEYMH